MVHQKLRRPTEMILCRGWADSCVDPESELAFRISTKMLI